MARNISTRRYAQAIFQIAIERDSLETWLQDLAILSEASINTEFASVINSPTIPTNQKKNFIQSTLSDSVSSLAINLVMLLGLNSNFESVPEITEYFQKMMDSNSGIEKAEIISAVKLSNVDEENISRMIKSLANKDIQLTNTVDEKILGGFIARVGDKILDGSTKSKLSAMRKGLKT